MAVARKIPTCHYCGKPIAKGIYKDYSDVPSIFRPIGDSFVRWMFKECNCEGAKEARKKMKEGAKEIAKILSKDKRMKKFLKTDPP